MAYQSNKQDFQALLTAFLDVLHLDDDHWQNVAEYERLSRGSNSSPDCHCMKKEREVMKNYRIGF